eukprot:1146834-Pelagomonas_calceolata.AAC.1
MHACVHESVCLCCIYVSSTVLLLALKPYFTSTPRASAAATLSAIVVCLACVTIQWANELGGIFLLNILTRPCYVISNAALAARVLSTRGSDRFRKAPQLTFGAPSLFNDCKEDGSYQAF